MAILGEQVPATGRGDPAGRALAALLAGASVEVLPRHLERFREAADPPGAGTQAFVPFLPDGSFAASLAAARGLRAAGADPVLHVPARRVRARAELADVLAEAPAAGVREVLLVAGDPDAPAGPFASTLDLLATGLLDGAPFRRVDFAGHPEGHPRVPPAALLDALAQKLAWSRATGMPIALVTQFTFDAAAALAWEGALRRAGLAVPVRIGLPGPASLATLVSFAMQLGVAASAKGLSRRPQVARLLGRWTPDEPAEALAAHAGKEPGTLVEGIHLYPFGGLAKTLAWLADARRRAGLLPA